MALAGSSIPIRWESSDMRSVPIPSAILTLVVGMILVLAGLWVGQNINLLPAAASSNAPLYDELFAVLFTIGTILFLGILGLLIFSLVRFRRRDGDSGDGVAVEGNLQLEIFWTAIPAIVVLFVGIYSYDIYDRMGGMIPLADPHSMHGTMDSPVAQASVRSSEGEAGTPRSGEESVLLLVEASASCLSM